jgi:hypothetical protein
MASRLERESFARTGQYPAKAKERVSYLIVRHSLALLRIKSIFAKLVEHGWGPELDKLNAYYHRPLLDHPLVKQPKDLTLRSAYDFQFISLFNS